MTAKSNAAITLEREQEKRIVKLLKLSGERDPVIVDGGVTALTDAVIEVLYSVEDSPGHRTARSAWLCKDSGSVQIMDGFPVL